MVKVALLSPIESLVGEVEAVAHADADVAVVAGDHPDVEPLVSWVLDGGTLIVCGPTDGPLLPALHLLHLPGGTISGAGRAIVPGAALAGPRGSGQVIFLARADPALFARALDWICPKMGSGNR